MDNSRPSDNWATHDDWAKHRSFITDLYTEKNRPLKEVMQIMREKHQFSSTQSVYQAFLQAWGLRLNMSVEDNEDTSRQQNVDYYSFLKTPQYIDWLDTSNPSRRNSILWIIAKSGAKKSTLLNFLLNTCRSRKERVILSFKFDTYGDGKLGTSAECLYKSLLFQLLEARPNLQDLLNTIRIERRWSFESVRSLLGLAIRHLGKISLMLFIDALDECKKTQIWEVMGFLEDTCEQASSPETIIRICVASRPRLLVNMIQQNPISSDDDVEAYISAALRIGDGNLAQVICRGIKDTAPNSMMRAAHLVDWLNEGYQAGYSQSVLLLTLYKVLSNSVQWPQISEFSLSPHVTGNINQLYQRDVNREERPKGPCDTCKRRRIRCDKQLPMCTQCIRSERRCGWVISNKLLEIEATAWTKYITIIAYDLFAKIEGSKLSDHTIEKLSRSLPRLLTALALKIGYQDQTRSGRDTMVFIHTRRQEIATIFKNQCDNIQDSDYDEVLNIRQKQKPTEIMGRWLPSMDGPNFEKFRARPPKYGPEKSRHKEVEDDIGLLLPDVDEYRRLIVQDPSYAWMLARLRREIVLTTFEYNVLPQIKDAIEWAIPQTEPVSRDKAPGEVQVTFTVEWDILLYLRQQNYDKHESEAIAKSITLTGTRTHAQALTCRQYVAQVWPVTGLQTLRLIQETLKTTQHRKALIFNAPCRLSLEAFIVNNLVIVEVLGLLDFIVEIGEQLAWLSSALRPSRPALLPNTGIFVCMPFVDHAIRVLSKDGPPKVTCVISCSTNLYQSTMKIPNGQCWSYLFSNPVIAYGFPILQRVEQETGLEMPLQLMTVLTGTRYLNTFNSNVFIKGFNTMLVPMKQSEDLLVWHLLYSQNPSERISYLLTDFQCTNITMADIEKFRHVLGWCADVSSIVGTTHATYNIGKSHLPRAHSHHMLEKVEISAGQFVTGTAAFTLGNREKPVHISRFGFLTKLQWISSKHMVLWDEGDKRGWLVNGASALLHILRASLAHSKRKFKSAWLLDPSCLKDCEDTSRPDSCLQVLINEENRNLTLYMDKTEVYEETIIDGTTTNSASRTQTRHYRLEDKIEHIYNMLEKLIDHQTDIERRSGLQITVRPRRELEGWDFRDLVKDGDPIFPRVSTMPTIGKGWVDFTRAIHAVTLFGKGFGEIIQPRQTKTSLCSRWSLVPKESYYLAACVSNLLDIMEDDGDPTSNPRRLCENIIWHMKQATFDPCPCIKNAEHKHYDPVQALFPLKFIKSLKKKPQVDLKDRGAVIFGHNMSLHWHWKDTGDPVKGDPPLEVMITTDSFEDSGIGSSLSSSKSLSTTDPSDSGSTGDNSPTPHRFNPHANIGSKRGLRCLVSSASKRLKR